MATASPANVEALAKLLYACQEFERPWDHPETQRIWRKVMLRYAQTALKFAEALGND